MSISFAAIRTSLIPPAPFLSPKAGEKGEKNKALRVFDRLACQKHARIVFSFPSGKGGLGRVRSALPKPLPVLDVKVHEAT
jgi:hypothetical protein